MADAHPDAPNAAVEAAAWMIEKHRISLSDDWTCRCGHVVERQGLSGSQAEFAFQMHRAEAVVQALVDGGHYASNARVGMLLADCAELRAERDSAVARAKAAEADGRVHCIECVATSEGGKPDPETMGLCVYHRRDVWNRLDGAATELRQLHKLNDHNLAGAMKFRGQLAEAVDLLRRVNVSQWQHRCSDDVGGCTAVSDGALREVDAFLTVFDNPVTQEAPE